MFAQDSRPETVLRGLTILLHELDDQQLSSIERKIISIGGVAVCTQCYRQKIDYVVVPFVFNKKLSIEANIVTYLWIEDCYNSVKRVPVEYYHKPVTSSGNTPLINYVITIANFVGSERLFLQKVSLLLGAHYQNEFSRISKLEENIKVTTHLICSAYKGQKFESAVKWGIPVVSKEWLIKYVTSKQSLLDDKFPSIPNIIISVDCHHNTLNHREKNVHGVVSTNFLSTYKTQDIVSAQDSRLESILKGLTILLHDLDAQQLQSIKRKIISIGGIVVSTQCGPQNIDYVVVPFVFNEKLSIEANNIVTCLWIEDCCNNAKRVPVEYYHKPVTSSGTPLKNNCVITVANFVGSERLFLQKVSLLLGAHYQDGLSRISKPEDNIKATTHLICCALEGPKYENAIKWDVPIVSKDWLLNCMTSNQCLPKDKFPVVNSDVSKMNGAYFLKRLTKCNKKFSFTSVNFKDRKKYRDAIEKLGAQVLLNPNFCNDVTHVLMDQPSTTEKYLCSLASGKWILHSSYIDACLEKNCFLPEDKYEWGNPLCQLSLLTSIHGTGYHWRSKICSEQYPAFSGMKAILFTSDSKYQPLKRLIQAGGGVVLDKKDLLSSTHCFVDQGYDNIPVLLQEMAVKRILLLRAQFLADFLTNNPTPDPKQYLIPDYQPFYNKFAPNP